jgi:predicted ester cyclase
MGVAPTNQQFTFSLLMMDRIVDGKIVLHHANADWISVLVKLGVVPPLPSPPKPAGVA